MKQSKRMLAVLLSIIMICSTFTIGASAARTTYADPAGYDEVLDPYVSEDQAACMLLDYLDDNVWGKINIYWHKTIIESITIDIHDTDSLLGTLNYLNHSTALKLIKTIASLGDIEKLNLGAGDITDSKGNQCRRGNSTSTDFEVLFAVLSFLENNAYYISKFVYNGFDFGWLESLGAIDPAEDLAMLNDIHGTITSTVYDLIYGEGASTAEGTAYTNTLPLDDIIENFIQSDLVKLVVNLGASGDKNKIAEFLGLEKELVGGKIQRKIPLSEVFPSLTAGKLGVLSFKNDSVYDFFTKIFKAVIQDVVVPKAGSLLADALGADGAAYIDIVLPILGIEIDFPENADTKTKVDMLLDDLFVGKDKNMFFTFKQVNATDKYLTLAPGFWAKLTGIIRTVLPMLPPLLGDDCPNFDKTDAEIQAMTEQQFITYVIQACLEKFVDGVDFAEDCVSLKDLASRTLIEVCAGLMPSYDFEAMFESGQRTYDSDDCLDLLAYVLRYYLNGETTIQDNTPDSQMGLVAMLNTAADWGLAKVGALFGYDPTKYTSAPYEVWTKAYDTVFQWLPINMFYGLEDGPNGVRDLIMNRILGGVLEFVIDDNSETPTGLNALLSIFGRHSKSEFNKKIPEFIIDLLGRIINPLFGLPTERDFGKTSHQAIDMIIPYSYTSLDQLITVKRNVDELSLTNTAYRLLLNLPYTHHDRTSLLYQAMPLVMMLMGLWSYETYPFIPDEAPADFGIYSGNMLVDLYNANALSNNENLSYDDDNYIYFHMVDFQPFLYLDYRRALNNLGDLAANYTASLTNSDVEAPSRTEMTNAAYKYLMTKNMLEEGYNYNKTGAPYSNYGETTADNYQLMKAYNKVMAKNHTQANDGVEGAEKTYTERTWSAYQKALAFAQKVIGEYNAAANSDDPATALRDMRQSRINMARKMLLKADKELKSWIPLADYSMLDNNIEVVSYNTSLRRYSPEAIQKAIDEYLEAIGVDRDLDQDSQPFIDRVANALDASVQDLDQNLVDSLYLMNDGAGQYIDENNSYLYGLEEGFANQNELDMYGDFDGYFASFYGWAESVSGDPYMLGIDSTKTGNGTGAVIKMYNMEDTEMTNPLGANYTVILFGDVDGDAYADARDAILLRAYSSLKLTKAQLGAPAVYAADVDQSGYIDMTDARNLEKSGLKKVLIDQAPESLTSRTFGILDRLGLR